MNKTGYFAAYFDKITVFRLKDIFSKDEQNVNLFSSNNLNL